MTKPRIAMIGAGSWGTAMAIHIARGGFEVLLWGHRVEHVRNMLEEGMNQQYLPNIPFPESLLPVYHLERAIEKANEVIIAVPSHAFREVLEKIKTPVKRIAWLSKGIEPCQNELLSELVQQRFGQETALCFITGPSFAKEVANGLPTALSIVSNHPSYQKIWVSLIHHHHLRPYLSNDLIGAQLCGAVKNVIAIACGLSDGLGFGANARAALITRGLAEMKRLGLALGAKEETFSGLAGLGDLVLTCTDNQSRNRRFGLLLGQGKDISSAEKHISQVVEGKFNAKQVCALAEHHQVEMPICQQIADIMDNRVSIKDASNNLLERPLHEE